MPIDLGHHAPHPWFSVRDDCPVVAGQTITDMAARVGRTPFYVYDREVITAKVRELRDSLPSQIHLHYAVKANPMPAVIEHMASLVDGFDVASAGELAATLAAGGRAESISFAGPGKTAAELERAVAAGITINIESE